MMHLLTAALSAAQVAPEEPKGIDLVLPDLNELIAGIIAFLIVFGFIWWKGGPLISRMITSRQEAIRGQWTEAENAKSEAERLLEDYRRQVAGAREEANGIVEEARRAAEAIKAEIVARAKAEAEEMARRARQDIAVERERAMGEIRDLVALLSLELAQKVVAGSVDAGAQQALVDAYIDELAGLAR